ncbi:MAG TPA: hypothetical protein VLX28_18645 [Thermoanaerobaculia bacterium]|nr:hypothetical protein [Thermoanaerobaculia bacterium]
MSKDLRIVADEALAFGRYLSWADLQKNLFEREIGTEVDSADHEAMEYEWRWFGLMCYWYSSLQVVVEAWDTLGFSDPIIDQLLAHPQQLKKLLRRYRNATFHYQPSLLDPKFIELLENGAVHVYWVRALHDEFVRFFAEFISAKVTDNQQAELRENVETALHWFPYREAPQLESLERTLSYAQDMLAKYPDDQSEERQELQRTLESGEETLREGSRKWAILRAHILREAGVE